MTIDENDVLYVGYRRNIEGNTLGMEEVVYIISNDAGESWTAPVVLSRENHDAGYLTFAARVVGDGVDAAWRESSRVNIDDDGTTAVLHAKIDRAYPTSVKMDDEDSHLPTSFTLEQNYPNPFNPATNIAYTLPKSGQVNLTIYTVVGKKVKMYYI